MTERKMINKEVATLEIDGYLLKDVIEDLTRMLDIYGETAQVSKENYRYEEGHYFALLVPTLETDEEMQARIRQESFCAAIREDKERRDFERLQAKFGNIK